MEKQSLPLPVIKPMENLEKMEDNQCRVEHRTAVTTKLLNLAVINKVTITLVINTTNASFCNKNRHLFNWPLKVVC